jgi:hypothetical protein
MFSTKKPNSSAYPNLHTLGEVYAQSSAEAQVRSKEMADRFGRMRQHDRNNNFGINTQGINNNTQDIDNNTQDIDTNTLLSKLANVNSNQITKNNLDIRNSLNNTPESSLYENRPSQVIPPKSLLVEDSENSGWRDASHMKCFGKKMNLQKMKFSKWEPLNSVSNTEEEGKINYGYEDSSRIKQTNSTQVNPNKGNSSGSNRFAPASNTEEEEKTEEEKSNYAFDQNSHTKKFKLDKGESLGSNICGQGSNIEEEWRVNQPYDQLPHLKKLKSDNNGWNDGGPLPALKVVPSKCSSQKELFVNSSEEITLGPKTFNCTPPKSTKVNNWDNLPQNNSEGSCRQHIPPFKPLNPIQEITPLDEDCHGNGGHGGSDSEPQTPDDSFKKKTADLRSDTSKAILSMSAAKASHISVLSDDALTPNNQNIDWNTQQPEMLQPEMLQPEMLQPEMFPDVLQPEMLQPEMLQPEMLQPEMVPEMVPDVIPDVIPDVMPEMLQPDVIQNLFNFTSFPCPSLYGTFFRPIGTMMPRFYMTIEQLAEFMQNFPWM